MSDCSESVSGQGASPQHSTASATQRGSFEEHCTSHRGGATSQHALSAAVSQGTVRSRFAAAVQTNFCHAVENPSAGASPSAGKRFRGVTKHKRTQRFEAHIWECKKQIYLGGFDTEVLAARSHDIMALRCKGRSCDILNFDLDVYAELLPLLERLSREDIITALRNYSKAQTAARTGGQPPSPGAAAPSPSPHRPRHRAARRPTPPPTAPVAAFDATHAVLPRRLSIKTGRRPPPTESSDEESDGQGTGSAHFSAPPAASRYQPYARHEPGRQWRMQRRRGPSPRAPPSSPHSGRLAGLTATGSEPPAPFTPPQLALRGSGARSLHHSVAVPVAPLPLLPALGNAEVDTMDLELDWDLLLTADEPSLTFSASDEHYLFESLPMDATHTALEHLSGAVLYQQQSTNGSEPGSPPSPISRPFGGAQHLMGCHLHAASVDSPFVLVTDHTTH